jgi:hypothetical protein
VTLYLHPGFNPPAGNNPVRVATDAPHGSFPVSLPVYPSAVRLSRLLDTPYGASQGDALYMQTAAAEYQSADAAAAVLKWYESVMPSCGWRQGAFWGTSSTSIFTSGHSFIAKANPNLVVLVSVGPNRSSGSYLALGAEEDILPLRPAASYLHGPFVQLRLALKRSSLQTQIATVKHTTVTGHRAIARLVSAINSIQGRRSIRTFCPGPPRSTGPAWLSFVRANGSVAHAYESGSGWCGGLAVNGVGWMVDPGSVWTQILALSNTKH